MEPFRVEFEAPSAFVLLLSGDLAGDSDVLGTARQQLSERKKNSVFSWSLLGKF